jgi:hypothetical protein
MTRVEKSFSTLGLDQGILDNVKTTLIAAEKKARSTKEIQSIDILRRGLRQDIYVGKLMVLPPSIMEDTTRIPLPLFRGAALKMCKNTEEVVYLETHRLATSEFDVLEDKDLKYFKDLIFKDESGKYTSFVVFLPAWANARDFHGFRFTTDPEVMDLTLKHLVFSAYYDPSLSNMFDTLSEDGAKLDAVNLEHDHLGPAFAFGSAEKAYPNLDKTASSPPKPFLRFSASNVDAIKDELLSPEEKNVMESLSDELTKRVAKSFNPASPKSASEEAENSGEVKIAAPWDNDNKRDDPTLIDGKGLRQHKDYGELGSVENPKYSSLTSAIATVVAPGTPDTLDACEVAEDSEGYPQLKKEKKAYNSDQMFEDVRPPLPIEEGKSSLQDDRPIEVEKAAAAYPQGEEGYVPPTENRVYMTIKGAGEAGIDGQDIWREAIGAVEPDYNQYPDEEGGALEDDWMVANHEGGRDITKYLTKLYQAGKIEPMPEADGSTQLESPPEDPDIDWLWPKWRATSIQHQQASRKLALSFIHPGQVLEQFYPSVLRDISNYPIGYPERDFHPVLPDVEMKDAPSPVDIEKDYSDKGMKAPKTTPGLIPSQDTQSVPLKPKERSIRGPFFMDQFYRIHTDINPAMLSMASAKSKDDDWPKKEQFEKRYKELMKMDKGALIQKVNESSRLDMSHMKSEPKKDVVYYILDQEGLLRKKSKSAGATKETLNMVKELLSKLAGEIASSLLAAYKTTGRPIFTQIPGESYINLNMDPASISSNTPLLIADESPYANHLKAALNTLTDSELSDAINDAWAQSAVWNNADEGYRFLYEVFVRIESVDTDTLIVKYKYVTGVKE